MESFLYGGVGLLDQKLVAALTLYEKGKLCGCVVVKVRPGSQYCVFGQSLESLTRRHQVVVVELVLGLDSCQSFL